jgi:membrane protein implicated in regulation of membrane protease activity
MATTRNTGFAKTGYWAASLAGIALWTGGVVLLSNLPLPTQLALGLMAAVVAVWGHAVLFGKREGDSRPASVPAQLPRSLPVGGPRRAVSPRRGGMTAT